MKISKQRNVIYSIKELREQEHTHMDGKTQHSSHFLNLTHFFF